MSTLSVPLTPHLEEVISAFVKKGFAPNKAEVVRKAIHLLKEDEVIKELMQAEKELKQGKILRGNLDTLAKKLK